MFNLLHIRSKNNQILRFKKHIFTIIIGIFCLSNTSSDVSPFPFTKSSLLWKIESPTSKTSYLFGTMHIIEKEYFIFPKSLEKLIAKSDNVIMELQSIPSPKVALPLITLKNGSFFDYFSKEQTDSILQWANSELKMNEQLFRSVFYKMKPFVVVQTAVQLQFQGKTESYEKSLYDISKEKKIETIGLETVEQQMNLFDDLTKIEQAELVMESIRSPKKSIDLTNRMQIMYSHQNLDSLFLLIQEEGGLMSKKQNLFIDERNKNWIPKIKNNITSKNCFIAVGAGHLGGENGVIRLLQKEGYTLTPILLEK